MLNKCYNQKILTYEKGSYDGIIDMIYVLTMEKSFKRHQSIYFQLNKFKLTKNAKIILNKGYKKCKKQQCGTIECKKIKTPPHDITHANNEILKDAIKNKYETILVLEDDFILSDKINNKKVIKDIKKIVNDYKEKELVLKLGCFPFITLPYDKKYKRVFLSSGAHAVVYNSNVMKKIFNSKKFALNDYDALLNMNFYGSQLMYKEPLIYQLWTDSENSKYWDDWNGGILNSGEWYTFLMKTLLLNKQEEPGTSLMYRYHNITSILLLIFFIIITYYLLKISYYLLSKR